jgi:hypothetical protein
VGASLSPPSSSATAANGMSPSAHASVEPSFLYDNTCRGESWDIGQKIGPFDPFQFRVAICGGGGAVLNNTSWALAMVNYGTSGLLAVG